MEAKSFEEVERLKAMLQAGQMPNSIEQNQHQNGHKLNTEAMEQEQHSGNRNFRRIYIFFYYFRKSFNGNMNDIVIDELFLNIVIVLFVYCCSLVFVYKPDVSKETWLFIFVQIGNKNES